MPAPILKENQRKKRFSKKELEKLDRVPIILGDSKIDMPPEVENNPVAKAKWQALVKVFANMPDGLITSADTEIIAQLCLLYADVNDMRTMAINAQDAEERIWIYGKIDAKGRLIMSLQDRLFLNPKIRKYGLPQTPKTEPDGELLKAGFDI